MSYFGTSTATGTNTTTEARVRAVMQKVRANFNAFVVAGHLTPAEADKWADDVIYLQLQGVLKFFEVQILSPGRSQFGIRYTVSADGSVQQDSASGGIDVYGLPVGTTVRLHAEPVGPLPAYVRAQLERRGWGFNGRCIDGPASEQRAFSSGGYGIIREHLGTWP
jgi:hypothetical protein